MPHTDIVVGVQGHAPQREVMLMQLMPRGIANIFFLVCELVQRKDRTDGSAQVPLKNKDTVLYILGRSVFFCALRTFIFSGCIFLTPNASEVHLILHVASCWHLAYF